MGKKLSGRESYKIVKKYVKYYYRRETETFYALIKSKMEEEDIINEVYLNLLKKEAFSKWDRNKSSKKWYISHIVRRAMIDLVRKIREEEIEMVSLEKDNGDGYTYLQNLKSKEDVNTILREKKFLYYIKSLSENKRGGIKGYSPILGKCWLNKKVVAIHLIFGFSVKEIAKMFKSKAEGREHISKQTVYKIRNEIKDNLVYV